jgi:hypothetical protein
LPFEFRRAIFNWSSFSIEQSSVGNVRLSTSGTQQIQSETSMTTASKPRASKAISTSTEAPNPLLLKEPSAVIVSIERSSVGHIWSAVAVSELSKNQSETSMTIAPQPKGSQATSRSSEALDRLLSKETISSHHIHQAEKRLSQILSSQRPGLSNSLSTITEQSHELPFEFHRVARRSDYDGE